jgi:hypothetical protein
MLRTPEAFIKEGSKVFRAAATDKMFIRALIAAAQSKAHDVEIEAVSLDTRVEAAYDAIFDCCLSVLNAAGYRITAAPEHHNKRWKPLAHLSARASAFTTNWMRFAMCEI